MAVICRVPFHPSRSAFSCAVSPLHTSASTTRRVSAREVRPQARRSAHRRICNAVRLIASICNNAKQALVAGWSSRANMSTSADRLEANITRVEKNYRVGVTSDGKEYFVRTTSMRVRTEWSKLRVGDAISFSVRYAAGRGIISDVIAVRNG